jgi:hypothetical protein
MGEEQEKPFAENIAESVVDVVLSEVGKSVDATLEASQQDQSLQFRDDSFDNSQDEDDGAACKAEFELMMSKANKKYATYVGSSGIIPCMKRLNGRKRSVSL